MRKIWFAGLVAVAVFVVSNYSVAAEMPGMEEKGVAQGAVSVIMKSKTCPVDKAGNKCQMRGMMGRTVVATSDGGVVIVMGNKIVKYDKNLKLVNEVEMKMDMPAMQPHMMGMKKGCPGMAAMINEEPTKE